MNRKKNISMKEIAQLSNVSVATVSRVINDNGRFSEETRERVLNIIKKYGYTTNMAAKSLRMSKSKTVGLIVPSIDNEWFSHLALEIENYFFEKNYSVFICNTSQEEEKEIAYFKSLDSKLVDGIICISGIEQIPDVITRDIPVVCIDRKPKDHTHAYYVESNHYSGGYKATEELIKQGCKRIVIVSRNKTLSVNKQRLDGYRQALKDYGIEQDPELEILLNYANYEGARKAINDLIKKGIPFDGVFGTNDWRAYGAMTALIENGIQVPQDVKVIGFDDISVASACYPSLSTIRQNIPALAKTASSLLFDLMSNKEIQINQRRYILPIQVIRRDSTKK
jgi:LacI family transcriptional regulator